MFLLYVENCATWAGLNIEECTTNHLYKRKSRYFCKEEQFMNIDTFVYDAIYKSKF